MNTQLTVLSDNSAAMQEIERFTVRLNEAPKAEWLQDTPDKKAKYIPIGILETQLHKDFAGLVQFEILSERRELNEYIITARIKVFHPVILQWLNYDGVGAVQIMQDANTKLSQFTEHKKLNALQLNAPKAYAEAIKNAAKKIGKKYGAGLNRKFEDQYEPEYTVNAMMDEVIDRLHKCNNKDELKVLWDEYPELQKANKFKNAFSQRKNQL